MYLVITAIAVLVIVLVFLPTIDYKESVNIAFLKNNELYIECEVKEIVALQTDSITIRTKDDLIISNIHVYKIFTDTDFTDMHF